MRDSEICDGVAKIDLRESDLGYGGRKDGLEGAKSVIAVAMIDLTEPNL